MYYKWFFIRVNMVNSRIYNWRDPNKNEIVKYLTHYADTVISYSLNDIRIYIWRVPNKDEIVKYLTHYADTIIVI